jgi:hypothetical protein
MDNRPLSAMIADVLGEVEELAERDLAGRAHEEVQARLAFLHDLLRRLSADLVALRREAAEVSGGDVILRETRAELRAREPAAMRQPSAALLAGDLDLLRLVEYTGAAITLVNERRATLRSRPALERVAGVS